MDSNATLIHNFYTAFSKRDYKTMQESYADSATFSDVVFQNLDAAQAKAMWQMLIERGKDLKIEFSNVQSNANGGSADWVATYSFSKTGRKVVNRIHATFKIQDGKITEHRDQFNFHRWAGMALGLPGLLLGWTPFMKNKIRNTAMDGLRKFMER